jgi:hypothetical protein
VTIKIPENVDWDIYRILTHELNRASRHEIETYWSLDDVDEMNTVLSAIEVARAQTQQQR